MSNTNWVIVILALGLLVASVWTCWPELSGRIDLDNLTDDEVGL